MFTVGIQPRLSYPNRFIGAGDTIWIPLMSGVIKGLVTSITDTLGATLTTRHPMSMVENVEIDHRALALPESLAFHKHGRFALNKADAVLYYEARKSMRRARSNVANSSIGYESLRRHYRIQKRNASVVITLKETDKSIAIKALESALKHTYRKALPYCFEVMNQPSGKAWVKFYFTPSDTNGVPPTLYIKSLRQADRGGIADVVYSAGFLRYTPEYFGSVEHDIVYY
jgi:hypothetical protein